jgi:hypothetical protein
MSDPVVTPTVPDTTLQNAYDPSVGALRLTITPQPLNPTNVIGPGTSQGQQPSDILSLDDVNKSLPSSNTAPIIGPDTLSINDVNKIHEQIKQTNEVTAKTPQKLTGIIANLAAGGNETVASMFGAPVDLATGAINLGIKGVNKLSNTNIPPITNPIGGSESIKQGMGLIGANPENVAPADQSEQIARAVGSGAVAMAVPFAVATALPGVTGGVAGTVTNALRQGGPVSNLVIGGVAGASGAIAENNVPAPYKSLANTAGQIVGGGVAGIGAAGVNALGRAGQSVAERFFGPIKMPGQTAISVAGSSTLGTDKQQQIAGQQIANAIGPQSSYGDVIDRLGEGNTENVPGSYPTSFEAAPLAGLGDLQRWSETRAREQFIQRANEQNAARVSAQQAMRPDTGADVGTVLRGELARADQSAKEAQDLARSNVQHQTEVIGGHGTPVGYGAQVASDISRNYAPAFEQADTALANQQIKTGEAVNQLGGNPATLPESRATAQQTYGEKLRGQPATTETPAQGLAGAKATRKQEVSSLYDAIPKDLSVNSNELKAGATKAESMVDEDFGDTISATERNLVNRIKELPETIPFEKIRTLRSNIGEAIREVAKNVGWDSRQVARLEVLKKGLDDTVVGTVENKIKQEAGEVTAGTLNQEDSLLAKLQGNLEAARDQHYQESGRNSQTGSGTNARGGSTSVRSSTGTAGQTARGSTSPASTSGVSPTLQPLDSEALSAERKARAEYLDYAQTFKQGSVGQVLAPGRGGQFYRLQNSEVPAKIWNSGKTAAEDIQGALKAAGNDTDFKQALTDYAAFDLRRSAEIRDANGVGTGRLNLKAYQKWMESHQEVMQAYENATGDTSLRTKFDTAQKAQQSLDDLIKQRDLLEKVYPLKPGGTNAELAGRYFQPGTKGAEYIDKYTQDTGGTSSAMSNLADYAASQLRSQVINKDGEMDLNAYQRWLNRYQSALSKLPKELRRRFENAAGAQQMLDEQTLTRADATREFERSVVRHYLGGQDPIVSIANVLASKSPSATLAMRDLISRVNRDPEALKGLQRDFMDLLEKRTGGTQVAGDTGTRTIKAATYLNMVRDNAGPIKELFGQSGLNNLTKIGQDIERSNLSVSGTGTPGRSNTMAEKVGQEKHGATPEGTHASTSTSIITLLIANEVGEHVVEHFGGALPSGAILGAGLVGLILNQMHKVGLHTIDELVTEATLHPEIMQALLAKVPTEAKSPIINKLNKQLMLLGTESAVTSYNRPTPIQPSSQPNRLFLSPSFPSVSDTIH